MTDLLRAEKQQHVVSAVWLRRIDDRAEVLVEIDGKWYEIIREFFDNNMSRNENDYSHIMELQKSHDNIRST